MSARLLSSWPAALAIVALGVLQQAAGHIDADNSWFITFAEKVFDGARAYVDVSDPNPPLGFLVYMPAVALARLFGPSAEFWTVVEILVCVAASLALTLAILRRAGFDDAAIGLLRNGASWLLLVAVAFGYAEREHFALIAAMPMIAVFAARAGGAAMPLSLALLAGVGGGVALAFKPYYALPLAAGWAVAIWHAVFATERANAKGESPASLVFSPENIAGAAVYLAYLAFVYLRFPDYFARVLPLAVEVYAPARNSLGAVLTSAPFLFNAALLGTLAYGVAAVGGDARVAALAAASAGFLATYALQGKNWFNHGYPGIALGCLAIVALYAARRGAGEPAARYARLAVLPTLVCAPFLGGVTMNLPGTEEYPGLTQAVRDNAPARPKIAALAQQLDVGHPLTRRLGGTWIGTQNALWVDNCVRQILVTTKVDEATREKLLAYAAAERAELARDVAAGRPDVLLVETPQLREWAEKKPEFARLFDEFAKRTQVGDIEVWARVGAR